MVSTSFSQRVAIVAAAAVVGVGGVVIGSSSSPRSHDSQQSQTPTPTPSPTANNLWITDGGGACTSQVSPVTYANSVSPDARCGTGSIAYAAANVGDTVGLKEPITDLTIRSQTSKGSDASRVTFRPDAGDTVQLSDLDVDGNNNIEVRDVTMTGNTTFGYSIKNANNVTYRNVNRPGGCCGGGINGNTTNAAIVGGDIGPLDPEDGLHINNQFGQNTNVTIDGVFIHDLTINVNPAAHDDCIQIAAANGLTIKNSRLVNCGTEGILLSAGSSPVNNVTIENNFFGSAPLAFYILKIPAAGQATNVIVRNNSFVGNANWNANTTLDVFGNIFAGTPSSDCAAMVSNARTFSNNVTKFACTGAQSNTVDANATTSFVNANESPATGFDLHLTGAAAALNAGKPGVAGTDFPTTDFDGQTRTSPPEAGADEVP